MIDNIIDHETGVTLTLAVAATVAIASLIWRVSSKTSEVINRLDSIEAKLDNHWTVADQLEWAVNLREQNPSLKVPLPKIHRSESE